MSDLDVAVRFLAIDGVTVLLELGDDVGFVVESVVMPDRVWRRSLVTADDVEGDVEQQSVMESGRYQLVVNVVGDSHADVEAKRSDLLAVAEVRSYLLQVTIEGQTMTWKARRADSSTGQEQADLIGMRRVVTLQVPVQPRTVEELA